MKKFYRIISLLLVMGILLAGCGGAGTVTDEPAYTSSAEVIGELSGMSTDVIDPDLTCTITLGNWPADTAPESERALFDGYKATRHPMPDELAMQMVWTLSQTEINGIIECCSGKPVSLGERAEKFIAENGLNIHLDYGKFKEPPYESPGVWGSAEKIEKIRQIAVDR